MEIWKLLKQKQQLVQLEAKLKLSFALPLSHEDLKVSFGCSSEQDICVCWEFVSKETVCVFSVWSLGRKLCYLLGMKALPWSTSSQTGSKFAGKKGCKEPAKCQVLYISEGM